MFFKDLGKIRELFFVPAEWSGKVREFCSDSGQILCNFICFVSKYRIANQFFLRFFSPRYKLGILLP